MNVLVVNAGSSSLKYQLFDTETSEVKAKGLCERIGIDGRLTHKVAGHDDYVADIEMKNHEDAVKNVIAALTDKKIGCIGSMSEIGAVGHRVVHGGSYFSGSVLVNDDVMEKLERCVDLAPLHTPPAIMGIKGCLAAMPSVPQVLVFDTAFHQTMPKEAYLYPIPYEYYEKYGIRKYGFHGTSHRYVSSEAIKLLGKKTEDTKIITCHLGNGSSISAVKGGKVIDTTMGFTPLDGLMMGTRSGSVDPAVVTFLMDKENLSISDMNAVLNKKSGFLGVSGVSSDCRDIFAAIKEGNERAKTAVDILCYQIKKYIGAYAAAMGGVDAIVFTAGIGENTPEIREGAVKGLEFLGVDFDTEANNNVKRPIKTTKLSHDGSKVAVYLIPTNEELVIAQDTAEIVGKINK